MKIRDFDLTRINPEHLKIGEPVPWPIYDDFGKLLMAKGATLKSDRQKEILARVGLFAKEREPEPKQTLPQPLYLSSDANPFAEYDDVCLKLTELFEKLESAEPPKGEVIKKEFFELAAHIQGLVHHHPDALLGALALCQEYAYPVLHGVQMAALAELMLMSSSLTQEQHLAVLSAAMTGDLAMHAYQEKLHHQKKPLNEKQQEVVSKHPEQSAKILKRLGIRDALWLELVKQHHERVDGTGYPAGVGGDELRPEARVIALSGAYAAMITSRPYRTALQHTESLKRLLAGRGTQFDERLTNRFIHQLGLYPPGSFVRLANGEIALVVGRTQNPKAPLVASVQKEDGDLFLTPRRRNTASESFAIKRFCLPDEQVRVSPATAWGINAILVKKSIGKVI